MKQETRQLYAQWISTFLLENCSIILKNDSNSGAVGFSKDYYTADKLTHMWDFNNERNFLMDFKSNTIAHKRGTVRWVPREYSYHNSPVIHIHGNVDPNSSFTIPARYLENELEDWTLDFEFGAGSHNLDHTVRDN